MKLKAGSFKRSGKLVNRNQEKESIQKLPRSGMQDETLLQILQTLQGLGGDIMNNFMQVNFLKDIIKFHTRRNRYVDIPTYIKDTEIAV